MTGRHSMRIALLTHSTNPRGGVVHTLELGSALHDQGQEVTLFAPAVDGRGFFRQPRCAAVTISARPVAGPLNELVAARIAEYVAHFRRRADRFDIYHAQDAIGANALADLKMLGAIPGFARTVHHLDAFPDARLQAWQDRSILAADRVFCVSRAVCAEVRAHYAIDPALVPNGVDLARYTAQDPSHAAPETNKGVTSPLLPGDPLFLSIGGVEQRKNTHRIVEAFHQFQMGSPSARLIIAGGASLLDHGSYQREYQRLVARHTWAAGGPPQLLGTVDDDDVPELLRAADALVFPSLKEGFGLVVLEAMACGTPVVVSRTEPFTEYLTEAAVAFCDPLSPSSIATAMTRALDDAANLRAAGLRLVGAFSWERSATRHVQLYIEYLEERAHARNAVSSSLA